MGIALLNDFFRWSAHFFPLISYIYLLLYIVILDTEKKKRFLY